MHRLDDLEPLRDTVQPLLDGRVADAEYTLHLLDRPVDLHEGHHKHLVLGRKARQDGRLELPFDGDIAVRQENPLHDDGRTFRQVGKLLPVLNGRASIILIITAIL